MTKQIKILFYTLIILIAGLSFSTSFFYAKSRKISVSPSPTKNLTDVQAAADVKNKEDQGPASSSEVTKATTSAEEPAHPSQIYTIQLKDTLFSIAQDNGLTLAELAEANGITDANKIQAGQVIVILKNGQVEYTIDNEQLAILQKQVDNGKIPWRLDPVETAMADAPIIFGLKISDKYSLVSKDVQAGQAIIKAESEAGNFLITLIQPNIKGDKGIWALKIVKKT